jgi:hypothetical protein
VFIAVMRFPAYCRSTASREASPHHYTRAGRHDRGHSFELNLAEGLGPSRLPN